MLAARVAAALGELALRIDHIGSTSVPGLPAKDVIDLQVIVAGLAPLDDELAQAGFEPRLGGAIVRDHIPEGWTGRAEAWDKRLYGARGGRPANLHQRLSGSPNERYALLFRDYLRASPEARDGWAVVKARIAAEAAGPAEYTDVKDPLTDVLMADAERWAAATGWHGVSD